MSSFIWRYRNRPELGLHRLDAAVILGLICLAALSSAPAAPPAPAAVDATSQATPPGLPITPALARWAPLAPPLFQHILPQAGLPNPITMALAQDREGYMWVGTQGGLGRWDGYRFRNYLNIPGDAHSLPDNPINTLHADSAGRLWVGMSSGGLARYDREHDHFVSFREGATGLSADWVTSLADDGEDGLWVGTNGGLDHLPADAEPGRGAITHYRQSNGLPADGVRALHRDAAGVVWVGTTHGLARWDAQGKRFATVTLPSANGEAITVLSLFGASDGRLWIGTHAHGAIVLDTKTGAVQTVPAPRNIPALGEARPGEIWLSSYADGLIAVDAATLRTHTIRHDPFSQDSLVNNNVRAMLRDNAGVFWLATDSGISRHDAGWATASVGQSQRIPALEVLSVMTSAGGQVWLGTLSGGIHILEPGSGKISSLLSDPSRTEFALPEAGITAMVPLPGGDIAVGTTSGLYRTDSLGKAAEHVPLPGLNSKEDIRVLEVIGETLWVGTKNNGLHAVALPLVRARSVRIPGLASSYVTVVMNGMAGSLWAGTNNALHRIDIGSGAVVETIKSVPADTTTLANGWVTALALDRQGRLWIGSFGGIDVLLGRTPDGKPRFHRLGTAQGLPNLNISKLLPDRQGYMWASTDDGIARIDPTTFAIDALKRADGVAYPGYWNNSGTVTAEGELLFGGTAGLTTIAPERLQPWRQRPPVVAADVRVGGKLVPSSTSLTITPDANSFAVEFSALDFSAPELNRYAYHLEGFDKDWIATDASRRLAAYTNLAPGHYTLQVRGSNRAGTWTEQMLTIEVDVLPAWYQTWWFRLAAALLFIGVLYAAYRARMRQVAAQHEAFETEIAARTAEVVQQSRR